MKKSIMWKLSAVTLLISILLLTCSARANANDERQVHIQLHLYKIQTDVSGQTSLTENLWEGIDHPEEPLFAQQGPITFFVTAELTMGKVKFLANGKAWTFDGKKQPPQNSGVEVLAAPAILANLEQEWMMSIGSRLPIEYFEKQSDGLYEHKISQVDTGLRISGKAEAGPSDRIILRDFEIALNSISDRMPLEDVSLNVGKPVLNNERFQLAVSLKPGQNYAIQIQTKKEGMLLLRLQVDWDNQDKLNP
jgi:hypothetical protein